MMTFYQPSFLSTRLYVDFRNDADFESRYAELLGELHGQPVIARPALGPNPFNQVAAEIEPRVSFDASNNNGRFSVGSGDMLFETAWSTSGSSSIKAYRDPPSIRSVALATDVSSISELDDASRYDTSSRVRTAQLGEIVIWRNSACFYLATRIEKVQVRTRGAPSDEVTFSYVIAPSKSADFRTACQD